MLRIVFLSTCKLPARFRQDPAFVYRCENLGHALKARGCDVAHDHVATWAWTRVDEAVVVQRPRSSRRLRQMVDFLRSAGVCLVADVDDLIFDEAYVEFSPAVRNGRALKPLVRSRFRQHRSAIGWFDQITVATTALSEQAERSFPGVPVTVLHNAVHWDWRRKTAPTTRHGTHDRTLIYLPGTQTHDRDFALIAEPLTRFLTAHRQVRLRVTGPLRRGLDLSSNQVEMRRKVGFQHYHEQFRDAWVNLAPLEDTPFNRCKSALKAIEAGYWGVPTVCSPNPDLARFAAAGAISAARPADWFHQLELLLDDGDYHRATEHLRERTVRLADIESSADRFVRLLMDPVKP